MSKMHKKTKKRGLERFRRGSIRNYIADNTAEFGCYHVDLTVCGSFHQICYSRFTDKQRVERVNNSMQSYFSFLKWWL